MNIALLRCLGLWAVVALSCLSTPLLAQGRSTNAGDPIVIDGYTFPSSISGLVRGDTNTYEAKGYGFSVRYFIGKDVWADIYLYDKQLKLDPPTRDALKGEMVEVLRAILMTQERGSYDAAKVESATLQKNLASARLRVSAHGREHMSFAYLTIAHGKFVKIRFSTRSRKTGQKQAEAFRNAVFGMIRKANPVPQPRRDPRFI